MANRIIEVVKKGKAGADGAVGLIQVTPKAAGFTATLAERGFVYRCSAVLTVAFDAASVLTNGWHCIVVASTGNNVTLDPDGSELIDGVATATVTGGTSVLVYCDGSALYTEDLGVVNDATLISIAALGTAADKMLYTTGVDTWAEVASQTLVALAALGTAADRMVYATALNTWAETVLTAAGRSILDDASVSAIRDTLEASDKVLSKSGAYTVVAADRSKLINCTATLTLTLTAAATLGDGDFFRVRADGGDVTIDPDGSETINGATTIIIPDGGTATVFCDGSNWSAITDQPQGDRVIDYQELTSGTTWTKPAAAQSGDRVHIHLVGGGASGERDSDDGDANGGGGGAGLYQEFPEVDDFGATEPYVIGAGHAGGSGIGSDGGDSSFGTSGNFNYMHAEGGLDGSTASGGTGGDARIITDNAEGTGWQADEFSGGDGKGDAADATGSIWGGGGGGKANNSVDNRTPGFSAYAGRGGVGSSNTGSGSNGDYDGEFPGGGGGGVDSSVSGPTLGGAGGDGVLRISIVRRSS